MITDTGKGFRNPYTGVPSFHDSYMSNNLNQLDLNRIDAIKDSVRDVYGFAKDGSQDNKMPEITLEDNVNMEGKIDPSLPKMIHINFENYYKNTLQMDTTKPFKESVITDIYYTPCPTNMQAFDTIKMAMSGGQAPNVVRDMYKRNEFGVRSDIVNYHTNGPVGDVGLAESVLNAVRDTNKQIMNDGKITLPDFSAYTSDELMNTDLDDLYRLGKMKNSGVDYFESSDRAAELRGKSKALLLTKGTQSKVEQRMLNKASKAAPETKNVNEPHIKSGINRYRGIDIKGVAFKGANIGAESSQPESSMALQ